ncbi:MAG: aspartate aminotransferase family protein [Halobacteriovoraceae bacterium]|nr:aspartate aminotransferase family protein [Halobacteriovoraceae bacterium]|tara:strand:- start:12429 stop:13688 length:1260 start_codon:yes stop_codon:yes gene_type:complete
MNSDQLFEKSLKYVPGGVHSPVRSFKGLHTTPRFIERAEGAFIYDEEGNDYIDFCMSFGPLILGHRNPIVEEAVKKSLERGWSYGACEKYSLELAEYIVERNCFIDKIRFVNSGTEAVMTAIRLARGYTGKDKIVKFSGCYHGHTDSMLIKAGSGLAGTSTASSKGVSEHISGDTLVCKLGDLAGLEEILVENKNQIAAVFIEPLPANNGLLIQEEHFLPELRKLCDKYQVLLVFDEVIAGFRVGFGGMCCPTQVKPDLVTYGKIIGGGFPVGAVASRAEIMDCLAPVGDVYQAGTLSANPVAMAAGLANLKQLTTDFYQNLYKTSDKIVAIFQKWMQKRGYEDYSLPNYHSLFWPVPTHDKLTSPDQIPANINERFYQLFQDLLERGIYLSPNAYEVGFVSQAHDEKVQAQLEERLWK